MRAHAARALSIAGREGDGLRSVFLAGWIEGMDKFVEQHGDKIYGTLSCFDRLLFRGYLPIMSGAAMAQFLKSRKVGRESLKPFLLEQAARLKDHAQNLCMQAGRHYEYLGAQELADGFERVEWIHVLGRYALRVNRLLRHGEVLDPMQLRTRTERPLAGQIVLGVSTRIEWLDPNDGRTIHKGIPVGSTETRSRSVFGGLVQIIVQSSREPGALKLTARAKGLSSMSIPIATRAVDVRAALP